MGMFRALFFDGLKVVVEDWKVSCIGVVDRLETRSVFVDSVNSDVLIPSVVER